MSDWNIHADQNLRLAQQMLKQQGEINALVADNREKDEELQTLASELTDLREILNTSSAAQLARDVLALVKDYSDPEQSIIARLPFLATFDQVCLEKYGVNLEDLAALDAPQRPEDTRETAPKDCDGFHWIGQSFTTCDNCGRPAWEHKGLHEPGGPFGQEPDRLREWEPGEAERIRAKWDPTFAEDTREETGS